MLPVDAEYEVICTLNDNNSLIKEPESFSMLPSGGFVIADGDKVVLYSNDGEQIRQIGFSGRALGEYNMPTNVKTHNDTVYVWSAMSLKFISYTINGEPIAEYKYDSAISDFIPSEDIIIVYNSGRSGTHIIDIYDKEQQNVVTSLTEAESEHRILLRSWASCPYWFSGENLYYMPRNRLSLYKYNFAEREETQISSIESTTFNVERQSDYMSILTNRQKASKYLRDNSLVIGLIPNGGNKFLALTLEGQTKVIDDVYDTSERVITIYDMNKGKVIARYTFESIGTQVLFSCLNNDIYFLKHSIENNDDVLMLCKLLIR